MTPISYASAPLRGAQPTPTATGWQLASSPATYTNAWLPSEQASVPQSPQAQNIVENFKDSLLDAAHSVVGFPEYFTEHVLKRKQELAPPDRTEISYRDLEQGKLNLKEKAGTEYEAQKTPLSQHTVEEDTTQETPFWAAKELEGSVKQYLDPNKVNFTNPKGPADLESIYTVGKHPEGPLGSLLHGAQLPVKWFNDISSLPGRALDVLNELIGSRAEERPVPLS